MKKFLKRLVKFISYVIISLCLGVFLINCYVQLSVSNKILTLDKAQNLEDVDCILVLGASVLNPTTPSLMLRDRLDCAIDLYNNQVSNTILMSGDHRESDYNEVGVMKNYCIEQNIPSQNIYLDHLGLSTYDSMYRAKEMFNCQKVVIVTQKYHLYRALYIANSFGINAYGVACEDIDYVGQSYREAREFFARLKDFAKCIYKPLPTFLGDSINLNTNGDLTNDK